MTPFKKTTTNVYFEATKDIEIFTKWAVTNGLDRKAKFGLYFNNCRYPIETDTYLELELNHKEMDMYDVLCAYFARN